MHEAALLFNRCAKPCNDFFEQDDDGGEKEAVFCVV